jgi:hypothetical protein
MPGMSRTENRDEFCPIEPWPLRHLFLMGVRRLYPLFWTSLNELWRKGDLMVRNERGTSPLVDWRWEFGAIDRWLFNAAKATIKLWDSNPEGGNAKLDPDYAWFTMPDPNPGKTWEESTRFVPKIDSPYPLWHAPDSPKFGGLDHLSFADTASALQEMEAHGGERRWRRLRSGSTSRCAASSKSTSEGFGFPSMVKKMIGRQSSTRDGPR